MSKVYFKNLNGIRFILAALVLLHHVAVVMQVCEISNIYQKIGALKAFGPVAVSLFFTLSGFLITYLLLIEREQSQTISLRTFYIARAKRILPIYYLIVILHLYILPHTPLYAFESKLLLVDVSTYNYSTLVLPEWSINLWYFILLPQVALAIMVASGNAFVPAGHVWSIGVEEIFYFLYPILLKKYAHKFKKFILLLIALYYIISIFIFIGAYCSKSALITNTLFSRILNFSIIMIIYNRINCMFIGAIAAYLLFKKHALLIKVTKPAVFYSSIIGIIFLFAIGARVPFLTYEVYCLLFVCILLYFIHNNIHTFLEHPLLVYLGKISYGIYMYQMIAIFFTVYLYKLGYINIFFIFLISFLITIILSAISFELIEKRIMKKR
ncbi:MAG TPA: acyltransferase [Chitinophagales bacterium]|nr:acyltransferase [Chitinophagales bacterium]HMX61346.1 acyltransferase [Chitinophagales bacterium]HMY23977.1 acyltransferase [Chitinophagales bacterium]HMZ34887.1 acyltransferase [Chitinophagales bacterium]HNA39774.1 acyltransferase [Chitinophagales bacterium]